jgi:hypothetical protein
LQKTKTPVISLRLDFQRYRAENVFGSIISGDTAENVFGSLISKKKTTKKPVLSKLERYNQHAKINYLIAQDKMKSSI